MSAIDFVVVEGPCPVGQWHCDEAGGAAVDSSTTVTADRDNAALPASGASRDGRGRRGVITKDATGAWPDDKSVLGTYADASSGLTHIGAREHDPVLARSSALTRSWKNAEPQTLNGYTHSADNPADGRPTPVRPSSRKWHRKNPMTQHAAGFLSAEVGCDACEFWQQAFLPGARKQR